MAIERDGVWWLEESEVAELEQISGRHVRRRMNAWNPNGPATDHQFLIWKDRKEILGGQDGESRNTARSGCATQSGVAVLHRPGRAGRLILANSLTDVPPTSAQTRWKQRVMKAIVDGKYDELKGASVASHPRGDSGLRIPHDKQNAGPPDSGTAASKSLNIAGTQPPAPVRNSPTGRSACATPASSPQLTFPELAPKTPEEEKKESAIALAKASMPAPQAKACIERFKWIEPLQNHDWMALGCKSWTAAVRKRARAMGVSYNTMLRMIYKYRATEDIAALANERPGPEKGTGTVLDAGMRTHLKRCWEVEKLTRAQCCRSLESYLAEKQRGNGARWIYEVPHRTTIERYINKDLQGGLNPIRMGEEALHAYAGHIDRRFTDLAALERVESDECRLNLFGFDPRRPLDNDGDPLAPRYWLLTFYDCRSIYPTCWSLVHGSEFELKHGIAEEDEINLFDYLIRNYGKPAGIHSDRGRFRGKRFGGRPLADKEIDENFQHADGILDDLNIAHNTPRVHNPRGTRLERFHRWVADWFRGKPGWIGANHKERKMTNGDADFAQYKLWVKGKLAPGTPPPLLTYDQIMAKVNEMMEAWRDHLSEGTDMNGLSPRAVFNHATPQGGFERISEERLNLATAERYPDEGILAGGIIQLPDGSRYSHPLLVLIPKGEKRTCIRLRHDHSSISVLPSKNGEETIVAPRRIRVGGNDPDELARQTEQQALLEKTIAGFGSKPPAAFRIEMTEDPKEQVTGDRLQVTESDPVHPEVSSVEWQAERMHIQPAPVAMDLKAETITAEDSVPSLHELEEFDPTMEEL
jgi:hypothetical protein